MTVTTPAIDKLRRSLSPNAALLTPLSAGYNAARQVENKRFDKRPAVIVSVATDADVAATIRFSRDEGLILSIRAGGTSPAGFSSNDGGVLLDLSKLQAITPDTAAMTVEIGSGVLLSTAYTKLGASGLTIVGGECNPVGVSGVSLGGGFSLLSRKLGLACDNVVRATVVKADGAVVVASKDNEPDLFWALRGAGGGNFGVVTSLELKMQRPEPAMWTAMAQWPLAQAPAVLTDAMAYFHAEAPDELNAIWALGPNPAGSMVLLMIAIFNGPPANGATALARLTSIGKASQVMTKQQPYSTLLSSDFPAPAQSVHDYFKSGFVKGPLPHQAAQLLADRFASAPEKGAAISNLVLFELAGGAINRVPAGDTAFVHRDQSLLLSVLATWQGRTGSGDPAEKTWADKLHADLAPYYSGQVYQNYPDADLKDWAHAYYGTNLERLIRVKKQYDPGNVFRFAQSIPVG